MAKMNMYDCPCGSFLVFKRIRKNEKTRVFYSCTRYPDCDYTMRAREDGTPIGTPADKVLRHARGGARIASDKLWRSKRVGVKALMERNTAFRYLKEAIGLKDSDPWDVEHLDAEQCQQVCDAVTEYLRREKERKRAQG